MKALFYSLIALVTSVTLMSCAPSAQQMKKVMEDNPDILFAVIEKHPDKFLKVVNEAAQKARAGEEERYRAEEGKKREEEFKNPLKPVVADTRISDGPKNAPITIVEYSDFQCPFCRRGHSTMKQVRKEYGDKVRVVFKNFPIERIHPHALKASQYYEAIGLQDQGKALKFLDLVFENQNEFSEKGEAYLKTLAQKVGANMGKLTKDASSSEVNKIIEEDKSEADKFGFSGTPGYLINGVSLKGAYPFDDFKQIIDRHLASAGGEAKAN